jgi:glycosyltransferase involved in cell wall biosynthesis
MASNSTSKNKLFRVTTVPLSLEKLIEGQLHFMSQYFTVTAISSDEERLSAVGAKEGVKTFCVDLTRKITPMADLKALLKLYRFLKKEKPLIVHSHTPKAGTIAMVASKMAGVPHRLHTVAGLPLLEATGGKRQLLEFVERITYSCATKVYPNSNGLRAIIVRNKLCGSGKLKVIGKGSSNGINTSYFNPNAVSDVEVKALKESLNIAETDFIYIFVGRLVGDKGINELINAFKVVNKKHQNTKLVLVGSQEPQLDPLDDSTIREIEANRHILTVGYKSDIRPYLKLSNILVFPSYREGFPNVVMQAGSMGIPSIVTDINGCNEIIEDGKNGKIIPPKDAFALADTMSLMLSDDGLLKILKANSRKAIVDSYEQQVIWDFILEEYRLLENNV